jgi:hypothetical protein
MEWDKIKAMYQRAVNLDSRYRQSGFLSHLKLADFSEDQIQLVAEIQKYTLTLQ